MVERVSHMQICFVLGLDTTKKVDCAGLCTGVTSGITQSLLSGTPGRVVDLESASTKSPKSPLPTRSWPSLSSIPKSDLVRRSPFEGHLPETSQRNVCVVIRGHNVHDYPC